MWYEKYAIKLQKHASFYTVSVIFHGLNVMYSLFKQDEGSI